MKKIARAAFVASFAASAVVMAWAGTAMAAGAHCNGVFNGKTPNNPIQKVANMSQAYAGQTVTFTVSFKSTGTSTNVVLDCYRVDNGSNSTLNAIVTGFNVEKTTANVGPKGTLQNVTFSIIVPSDPSLVGHSIVDRAKATKGSVESRSDNVSVAIVAPPSTGGTTGGTTTGGTTTGGTTTGGTTTGGTTGGTTVQGKTIHAPKVSVKGVQLAHTGPISAKAAFLGSLMIMIGLATRIRRPQLATPTVENVDNSGSSYLARYDNYLQAALRHRSSSN
jgi:hypothetical protein